MSQQRDRFRGEDALTTYVREHCTGVVRGEISLRSHEPAGDNDPAVVHDMRVSLRRLRSVMRSYAVLLDGSEDGLAGLDEDLRWLGSMLSDVRDADVLEQRLGARIDALDPDLVIGPVREDLAETLAGTRERTLAHWHEQRCTDRFRTTLRAVAVWCDRPPVAGGSLSDKRLREVARDVVAAAEKKARRRLAGADDDEAVHSARKAVKRLRYSAEAVAPVLPDARATARHAKRLQRRLGVFTDLSVEQTFLRHLALTHGTEEGHDGFTFGVLFTRGEAELDDLRSNRPKW